MARELAAALFEREAVSAAAMQKIELQFPVARDCEGGQLLARRAVGQRCAQDRDNRIADLHRLAGLKLERIDCDRTFGDAVVVEHDPRLAVEHTLPQVETVQRIAAAVPDDLEPRHPIDALRGDHLAVDAVELPEPLRDRGAVVEPFLALGGGVALAEPIFEGGDDADDVLLRHLHRPAQRLVRRAVAPGRLDEALVAEQEAAGLRPAQELAAAVDDQIGAAFEPGARPLDMLGGGIDHDRDAARLDHRRDLLQPHRGQVFLLAEQHDQRDRLFERLVEVFAGVDLDDMAADHPNRLIVGETLLPRDDDAVDHAVGKGEPQHLDRVVAGDAGGGAERDRGGAAAGHDAPFGAGQFGDALARGRHQLVEVDELARGGLDRGAHLRQHQAAAMHRAHAAAIDERPNPEREIGVGWIAGGHVTSGPDRARL